MAKKGLDLPPNRVLCHCMKQIWFVSQKVQSRALDCGKCGRRFAYTRALDGQFEITLIGKWKSDLERKFAMRKHAKAEIAEGINADEAAVLSEPDPA